MTGHFTSRAGQTTTAIGAQPKDERTKKKVRGMRL